MSLKIVTVIGARPQIIKASALSRAIRTSFSKNIKEVIIHTGQHYDENMSTVFFEELQIPQPDYNLNVGSGSHGHQTASMIKGIEDVLIAEKPDCLVLYGDTNSTLAGTIAASKLLIPIVHIEAGLRSFNKSMPEEINRIMCDHAATLLFSPTLAGYNHLIKEGLNAKAIKPFNVDNPGIYHCGDVMYDNSLYFANMASSKSKILIENKLEENNYILSTIHRNNNTDEPDRLMAIFKALLTISEREKIPVILPLHPRTNKMLSQNLTADVYQQVKESEYIKLIEPVSFLNMIQLEKNAKLVMTDSGGVQKEAFFFKKPCLILRSETEWVELVEQGTAKITDADYNSILAGYEYFRDAKNLNFMSIFGDGKASEFICSEIVNTFAN